jgi:hypothetical protein
MNSLCNIININDFIKLYFDDIYYKDIKYKNESLEIEELYGYSLLENKIKEYNKSIKNEQILEENKYKQNLENIKNYIDNYNNLSKFNQIKIDITYKQTDNYDRSYYFLYDNKYNNKFYEKLCYEYHINFSDFRFRRQAIIRIDEILQDKIQILKEPTNEIITYEELNTLYSQYCKNSDYDYTKTNLLIINKYINKLNFTHTIKCINCKILLNQLDTSLLKKNYDISPINDIDFVDESIEIYYDDNYFKKLNICKNCELLYNDNNVCNICNSKLVKNNDYINIKNKNNKYYHLDCYNDNINCDICKLESDTFGMHDICYTIYEILNEKKCLICKKNILNNKELVYINDEQLNEIIKNFNDNFINNSEYFIHTNCINIEYILNIISINKYDDITENIFNKIKLLDYDIDKIFNYVCFICNKKKFRLNLNKYTFESFILYLKNIKILEIKNICIYNHFDIPHKKYTYLCYNCLNKINNNNFYNKFFFDNLENRNLTEKQTKILNQIKNECI